MDNNLCTTARPHPGIDPEVMNMEINIFQTENRTPEWAVEVINCDDDGGIALVIFSGPAAEARAREYAVWKYN